MPVFRLVVLLGSLMLVYSARVRLGLKDTLNRTETKNAADKITLQGKDRLGVGLTAQYSIPDDDVTAAAVTGLANFDFSQGKIGQQLLQLGKDLLITGISLINPVLGAIVGIFTSMFGGGGSDLYGIILKKVNTMIKGSLASFANDLRDTQLQATLQTINFASAEVHWDIIAHDFLASSPLMFNSSCWRTSRDTNHQAKCVAYQDDGFRALKYELEYVSLVQSGVVEMLRFETPQMDCRAASMWPTMNRMRVLLKEHFGRWKKQRHPDSRVGTTNWNDRTVRKGKVQENSKSHRRRRTPCYVSQAVRDNLLKSDVDKDIYHKCYTHKSECRRPGGSVDSCVKGKTTPQHHINICRVTYLQRIDEQMQAAQDVLKGFDKFVERMHFHYVSIIERNGGKAQFSIARGANTCATGASVPKRKCLAAAQAIWTTEKVNPRRKNLVSGHWNHIPFGCSVQAKGDWTAHYNHKPNDLNGGGKRYAPVCAYCGSQ